MVFGVRVSLLALADLELMLKTRLASNLETHLPLPPGILKGIGHYA